VIFTQSAFFCRLLKNSGFVSGYRFSDTGKSSKLNAPLGGKHSWLLPLHTFPIPFRLLVSTSFDPLSNMQS